MGPQSRILKVLGWKFKGAALFFALRDSWGSVTSKFTRSSKPGDSRGSINIS